MPTVRTNTTVVSGTAGGDLAGTYPSPTVNSFRELEIAGEGMVSETGSRLTCPSSGVLAASTTYLTRVALKAGQTVTRIAVCRGASGSLFSVVKVALFDKTGASQLAVSNNEGASFSAAMPAVGQQIMSLSVIAPYSVTASDLYYAAIYGSGTTMPSLVRHGNGAAAIVVGSGIRTTLAITASGADMPSTVSPGDQSTGVILPVWFGIL